MNMIVWTYLGYIALSVAATFWIGCTLRRRGRSFLSYHYHDNDELAPAMSDLLSVGFYALHIGFAMVVMRYGASAQSLSESIEALSTKIGIVLSMLAVSHFAQTYAYWKMQKNSVERDRRIADFKNRPTDLEPLTAEIIN